jgi:hypothetical protein
MSAGTTAERSGLGVGRVVEVAGSVVSGESGAVLVDIGVSGDCAEVAVAVVGGDVRTGTIDGDADVLRAVDAHPVKRRHAVRHETAHERIVRRRPGHWRAVTMDSAGA